MGFCCSKDDEGSIETNQKHRRPKAPTGSMSDVRSAIDFNKVRNDQRRLTAKEIADRQDRLLDFKESMKFKKVKRFDQFYIIRQELGAGAFGSVKLGEHCKTHMACAIKIIKKQSLRKHQVYEQLNRNEFEVLEETQHPHITRIFELMEDDRNFYIVAELVTGGDLLKKIMDLQTFTEEQACDVIKQLLLALNFMHKQNIMHRDLKPENILVEQNADINDQQIRVKLTDFGFATRYNDNDRQNLSLGSPLYMAPELCKEDDYDYKVDVWAVGVISYILLTGRPPFYDRSQTGKDGIYDCIINDEPDYDILSNCSSDASEFIKNCLHKNARSRQTTEDLLNTSWITNHQPTSELSNQTVIKYGKNLAAFAKTTSFQSGVCSLLANLLTKAEDLQELSALFKKWDSNNDGFLSFEELEENMADLTQLFSLNENEIKEMLRNADVNKDDRVDYTEFVTAAFDKQKLLNKENLDKVFKMLDADGDGKISRQELQSVFGTSQLEEGEATWLEIMEQVDTDKDGFISYEEFNEHMFEVIKRRSMASQ